MEKKEQKELEYRGAVEAGNRRAVEATGGMEEDQRIRRHCRKQNTEKQ